MLLDLERARQLLTDRGLDALVAGSPENFHYASNFPEPFMHVGRHYLAFTVIPLEGEPAVITNAAEADHLERYSWIDDHRFYASGIYVDRDDELKVSTSPEAALAELLDERGLDSRVGIDRNRLLCSQWDRIQSAVDDVAFEDATDLFYTLRSVKSKEAIERIRRATEFTKAGIRSFMRHVEMGVSEIDLKRQVEIAVAKAGGEFYKHHPGQLALGAGVNSANGTAQPTDYRLEAGDVARIDLGAIYEGFTSDVSRVTTVGQPSERVCEYYNAVREAQRTVRNRVEPGVEASTLFEIGQQAVRDSGYPNYRRGHVGHGIGLEHHEPPLLGPENDTALEPGMVLAIEIPFHINGFAGFNVEDVCLVTTDGCEVFSDLPYELNPGL